MEQKLIYILSGFALGVPFRARPGWTDCGAILTSVPGAGGGKIGAASGPLG